MSIARQLYQLQEIEIDIESNERTLSEKTGQLGESQEVAHARTELESSRKGLEELRHQQRSLDWEIDDISGKLKVAEDKLYGGRIANPKELSSLQHEVEIMKASRNELEDKALDLMGQVEALTAKIGVLDGEFKKLEIEEQERKQRLSSEIEAVNRKLSELKSKQIELASMIEPKTIEFYRRLREQKGMAVARVEQGRCRGCRILLATTELQRARNSLVQCSSCGRILYVS